MTWWVRPESRRSMRSASSFVAGLAENLALDHDDSVRAQNKVAGMLTERGLHLLSRQALRAIAWALSRPRRFGNVGGMCREGNARVAQQLLAARRRGSEYEHGLKLYRTVGRQTSDLGKANTAQASEVNV